MSSPGIGLRNPIGQSLSTARSTRLASVVALACCLVAVGGALLDHTPRHEPEDQSVSASGAMPALRLTPQPDTASQAITAVMRSGLAADSKAIGPWVPDKMTSPALCALPPRGWLWSTVGLDEEGPARGASHRRHTGSIRLAGIEWRPHADAGRRSKRASDALTRLDTLLPLNFAELDKGTSDPLAGAMVHGLGAPTDDVQTRHAAALGFAADALRFDDHPGRLSAAAQAGLWNGAPATAMGVGYTLPDGRIRLDATGVTYVNSLATMGKTFQLSTVASVPLE